LLYDQTQINTAPEAELNTVVDKKRASKLLSITLANLNQFQ